MAVDCGVEFIPFIVLVGRDGNVIAVEHQVAKLADKAEAAVKAKVGTRP